ncbi:MAG: segregation/condensation protein A [Eubacteriales bacterium]|nr:segregation/condensation protein A [Eubacteriales bacterium]
MDSVLTNAYRIKIQNFEGPFDLLFHLIEKNQVSIYDIPISEITEQYLEYLFDMQQLNMEIASEFLVMASTLLHIKSRMLLPKPIEENEDEIDPREELIIRLVEYKKYKEISERFKGMEQIWSGAQYRYPEFTAFERTEEVLDLSPLILSGIYSELMKKCRDKMDNNQGKMKIILRRERVSLRLTIKEIVNYLKKKSSFLFSEIFSLGKKSKAEVVTAFLAILELARIKKVKLEQKKEFSEIKVQQSKGKSNSDQIILEDTYGN